MPVKQKEVNGTKLNYIEKGTGEAVVFVHGAVSDLRTWIEQIEVFSERYRAVSFSRRYHEPNEKAALDGDYSRALHTADLIEFLRSLKLGKAHLVGHSYGASIALMAALKEPELVASLTLGEPSPFPSLLSGEGASLLSEQKAGFDEAMRLAVIGNAEAAVRHFLHTVVGIDVFPLLPEARRQVVLENAETLLPMLRTYYDSPPLSRDQLRLLKVPALFITGELSPKISRLNNDITSGCLPNSRVAVLKGTSHGLQIENPAGFNRIVSDFLSETKILSVADTKQQLYEIV